MKNDKRPYMTRINKITCVLDDLFKQLQAKAKPSDLDFYDRHDFQFKMEHKYITRSLNPTFIHMEILDKSESMNQIT